MKSLIKWMPNLAWAKALQKTSLILSLTCLIAIPFCRNSNPFFPVLLFPLSLFAFPLYAGAILIMLARADGLKARDRDAFGLMFRGLSRSVVIGHKFILIILGLLGIYIIVRGLGLNETALLAIVSFSFFFTSYLAYRSVVVEKTEEAQQGVTLQLPPLTKSNSE